METIENNQTQENEIIFFKKYFLKNDSFEKKKKLISKQSECKLKIIKNQLKSTIFFLHLPDYMMGLFEICLFC